METYHFNVDPIAKPRMTQRDKWKNRPIVNRYNTYKDILRLQANSQGLETIPSVIESLFFYVPMPKSWSKKKKAAMVGRIHEQTPDIDNLLKGFMDTLCREDKHVAYFKNGLGKFWSEEGAIILTLNDQA
jgi:Holliday junction resolvase RusA-like endonuclease